MANNIRNGRSNGMITIIALRYYHGRIEAICEGVVRTVDETANCIDRGIISQRRTGIEWSGVYSFKVYVEMQKAEKSLAEKLYHK